jgi:hypothetical protein
VRFAMAATRGRALAPFLLALCWSVPALAADTDSDGMDDAWETLHFGDLSRDGTGDYDSDGMLDLEEHDHDLDPTVDDGSTMKTVIAIRTSSSSGTEVIRATEKTCLIPTTS